VFALVALFTTTENISSIISLCHHYRPIHHLHDVFSTEKLKYFVNVLPYIYMYAYMCGRYVHNAHTTYVLW